jgi:hypothetical protein
MRKSIIILLNLTFLLTTITFSQSMFYMPDEIKSAYENNTRSFDGTPGENYFRNFAEYEISVELNPQTKLLSGKEFIIYKNNSSDTLDQFIFNLYADIYKKGNTIDWSIGNNDLHDGVQIKSLKINNVAIDVNVQDESFVIYNTAMIVKLTEFLLPKSEINFEIEWEYPVPSVVTIRQGTYHETSFFIGYWYPKIAVYDDIFGWNEDVYSGQTEFYHEFANYKVSITAPDEYFVLASGLLKNEDEILSKSILKRYNEAKTSDEIVNVITAEDRAKKNITEGDGSKVWKFEAENLPDFAFAMSDTYLWDATSLKLGEKRVLINAVYFDENESFDQVAKIAKEVLTQLSEDVVGVNYPYPQMTAFMGHYGMEYPGMVNDGDDDYPGTVFVTAHEITHTYFPFYVATNETKYAWMDEGLVTFLPKVIENNMIENNNSFETMISTYNYYCGKSFDLPLMIPSDQLSGFAYRFHAYSKPAVAFYVLKQTLGEEVFDKCLKEFILRWNGKHPTGYDFFYTFDNVSGEDLSWFWQPWFFEMGYPDLGIKSVSEVDENKTLVEVSSIGNYPVPIKLTIKYDDDSEEIVELKASVWDENTDSYFLEIENNKKIKDLTLGSSLIPDKNSENNYYQMNSF